MLALLAASARSPSGVAHEDSQAGTCVITVRNRLGQPIPYADVVHGSGSITAHYIANAAGQLSVPGCHISGLCSYNYQERDAGCLRRSRRPAAAKGLLVWRKADNHTAFTDGYRTWVDGPKGVQKRLNTQRFAWEANPEDLPLAP